MTDRANLHLVKSKTTHPATSTKQPPTLSNALDSITSWIGKYTVLPDEHTAPVLALWAAHTWTSTSFYTTPRIVLSSPVPGSGKTRVLELLAGVTYTPKLTLNSSTAAIYRRIASALNNNTLPPTLLYDETDALFSARPGPQAEDIRALLNAGYKAGATVDRCEGDSHEIAEFPVFSPVALAGLAGHMPDTITTRAITIEMKKRRRGEKITPYRERTAQAEMAGVREFLSSWANGVRDELALAEPAMPKGVEDRPAEVWEPLLIVADAAGAHWPDTARAACRSFVFAPEKRPPSQGVELLADIRRIMGHDTDDDSTFEKLDRIRTTVLIDKLNVLADGAWGSMDAGRGITPRRVSQILAGYDVRAVSIRDHLGSGKGYTTYATTRHDKPFQAGLADAWSRYLDTPIRKVGDNGDNGDTAVQGVQNPSPKSEICGDTSVTPFGNASVTGDKKVTENMASTSTVTTVTAVTGSANRGEGVSAENLAPDPLDPAESDAIGVIIDALHDAGPGGLTGGRIMRLVREVTGDGSHVFTLLDEMVTNGVVRESEGRYYRKDLA